MHNKNEKKKTNNMKRIFDGNDTFSFQNIYYVCSMFMDVQFMLMLMAMGICVSARVRFANQIEVIFG